LDNLEHGIVVKKKGDIIKIYIVDPRRLPNEPDSIRRGYLAAEIYLYGSFEVRFPGGYNLRLHEITLPVLALLRKAYGGIFTLNYYLQQLKNTIERVKIE